MSLILERESHVNLNFSKQNEHFGIRVEHELDSQKKEKNMNCVIKLLVF